MQPLEEEPWEQQHQEQVISHGRSTRKRSSHWGRSCIREKYQQDQQLRSYGSRSNKSSRMRISRGSAATGEAAPGAMATKTAAMEAAAREEPPPEQQKQKEQPSTFSLVYLTTPLPCVNKFRGMCFYTVCNRGDRVVWRTSTVQELYTCVFDQIPNLQTCFTTRTKYL